MQLAVLGLNHKTAPIEVRENFSFPEDRIGRMLKRFKGYARWMEMAILSTCNRTEFYVVLDSDNIDTDEDLIDGILWGITDGDYELEHFYFHRDMDCIKHLFNVVSSLDSMVIGEGQILSQVKDAYHIAKNFGMTGTVLNTIFNRAIAVGKRVRTETRIAFSAVSISSAAVELAKDIMGDLSLASVLVIGAGTMSELTAQHLIDNGVSTVFVSNRNFTRAKQLAEKFSGIAIPFEDFLTATATADIIITSTGAPHYIIGVRDIVHALPRRIGRPPLVIIDIAVPRDVEPEVSALAGVTLYNIDDLEAVVDSNRETREQEALLAKVIIDEEMLAIEERLSYLSVRPVMTRLKDKFEFLREKVFKRTLVKLPNLDDKEKKVIEQMSRMLMRKFLREPMSAMNTAAGTELENDYKRTICELFLLEGDSGEEDIYETNDWD